MFQSVYKSQFSQWGTDIRVPSAFREETDVEVLVARVDISRGRGWARVGSDEVAGRSGQAIELQIALGKPEVSTVGGCAIRLHPILDVLVDIEAFPALGLQSTRRVWGAVDSLALGQR